RTDQPSMGCRDVGAAQAPRAVSARVDGLLRHQPHLRRGAAPRTLDQAAPALLLLEDVEDPSEPNPPAAAPRRGQARRDPQRAVRLGRLGHVQIPGPQPSAAQRRADPRRPAIPCPTLDAYPLSNYGPITSRNRPVRTRTPGGVGGGG